MNHRRRASAALCAAATLALTAACGGSGFDDDGGGDTPQQEGAATLEVLIASSGDAETAAVEEAAAAWAEASGNEVELLPAQDIAQQLAQGFAGGNPPDVFYVDAARFADLAAAGSLEPYADEIEDNDDFYESLRQTFTYEGEQYCVPKDFSTLALQIREDAWTEAGLTDADIPTTWEELSAVATRLTSGNRVGLVVGDTRDRIGAFMVQNGGWVLSEDGSEVTADTPENLAALEYVSGLLSSGAAAYPTALDSGWGGEALGIGRAAMAMEGNWIRGAMTNDYPDVAYRVVELPEGPAGKGTLLFTQCWGVAAASDAKEAAVDLVRALTTVDQQLVFAEAFGVMPSRESAREGYIQQFPDDEPFVAGAEYGQGPVNAPGMSSVLADFDSGLQQLPAQDPQQLLGQLQANAEAALGG